MIDDLIIDWPIGSSGDRIIFEPSRHLRFDHCRERHANDPFPNSMSISSDDDPMTR